MIHYPEAYKAYLIYFQAERDYFECHEVMEAYWKEHPDDERRFAYVGLIQLAVGLYHQRRNNRTGAEKMLQSAWNHLTLEHLESLGLDGAALRAAISKRIHDLREGSQVYEDFDMPIRDPLLLEQCMQECDNRGLIWNGPSDISNEQLIHKHRLRDRSEVIEQRNEQVRIRQQQRGV
jgi:predicted metal-dependent hydrolase